jgi:hypothetical protein
MDEGQNQYIPPNNAVVSTPHQGHPFRSSSTIEARSTSGRSSRLAEGLAIHLLPGRTNTGFGPVRMMDVNIAHKNFHFITHPKASSISNCRWNNHPPCFIDGYFNLTTSHAIELQIRGVTESGTQKTPRIITNFHRFEWG